MTGNIGICLEHCIYKKFLFYMRFQGSWVLMQKIQSSILLSRGSNEQETAATFISILQDKRSQNLFLCQILGKDTQFPHTVPQSPLLCINGYKQIKEVGGKRTLSITSNIGKKTEILHMGLSTCVKHCPIFFCLFSLCC